MRKAFIGGAVLAVVGLLLLSNSGLPLIVGRAPTSNPDPVGLPPSGPITDLDGFQVYFSTLDLETDSLGTTAGPEDSIPAAGPRSPVDISVRGEARSEPDGSTRSTDGTLAAVLLALIVFEAVLDQDRDRRRRAPAPAPASAA